MHFQKLQHTYEEYLQKIYYDTHSVDAQDANSLLEKVQRIDFWANRTEPRYFIIDYTQQQYVLFSEACGYMVGYHPRDFMDNGLEHLRHVFHKDDFKIYNNHIFSRNCAFLQSQPQTEHYKFVFSYNFRVLNKQKRYVDILQQGSYITSPETGLPIYSLGICINVSALKFDSRMVHTIEKRDNDQYGANILQEQNFYFPNEEDCIFSRKEKEVLLYMTEGLNAQEIAQKMHIAEHTVNTHRKNMLKKSNTKNAVELVSKCIRNNII